MCIRDRHFIGHFRRAPLATASSLIGCSFSDSVITNDCRVRVVFRWDESFGDGEDETWRAVAWVIASEAAAFISDFIRSIMDSHMASEAVLQALDSVRCSVLFGFIG